MNITVENFSKVVTPVALKNAPKVLKDDFDFVKENIDLYHDDDDIKKYIDTYVQKLNTALASKKPSAETKPAPSAAQKKTSNRPTNLAQLKKFLKENENNKLFFTGKYRQKEGVLTMHQERIIHKVQSNSFATRNNEGDAIRTDFGESKNWNFFPNYFYFSEDGVQLWYYYKKPDNWKEGNLLEPKAKKEQVKKETSKKPANKSKQTAKRTAKPKSPTKDVVMVAEVAAEVRFIKRYVLMDGKRKTRQQLLAFINSLQRAIEKKQIRKASRYATEIMHIQNELIKIYNNPDVGESFKFSLDETDKSVLEKYQKIAGSQKQRASVRLISRYVGIHGKTAVKEKAELLLKAIKNAFKKHQVPENDPYINELKKVEKNLTEYLKAKEAKLQINRIDLKGLKGIADIGLIKHNHPVQAGSKVFTPFGERGTVEKINHGVAFLKEFPGQGFNVAFLEIIGQSPKRPVNRRKIMQHHGKYLGSITAKQLADIDYETFGFTGKWKNLIGDPAIPFSLMFWSRPGLGKSTLAIELAKYMASAFHQKVLFVAAEEGLSYTLKEKFTRLNALDDNIFILLEMPAVLNPYDVVVIDSVTRLKMTPDDFVKLKAKYPEKSFILVFQATSDGGYRGSKEWEHEVDVSVSINDNGYAKVSKGRFGGNGTMKVFSGSPDHIYKFTQLQDAEKFVANRDEKLSMVQGDDGKVWVSNPDKALELQKLGYQVF